MYDVILFIYFLTFRYPPRKKSQGNSSSEQVGQSYNVTT